MTPTATDDTDADQSRSEAVDEQALPQTFLVTLPEGIESGQQIKSKHLMGAVQSLPYRRGSLLGSSCVYNCLQRREAALHRLAGRTEGGGRRRGRSSVAGWFAFVVVIYGALPSLGPASSGAEELPAPRGPENPNRNRSRHSRHRYQHPRLRHHSSRRHQQTSRPKLALH